MPPVKRGRPRREASHAKAAELGVTPRAMHERLAHDAAASVWGRTFEALPAKIRREIGLSFTRGQGPADTAMDLMMREADGPVEVAEEIRAMIRQACPHIDAAIARAQSMLARGWKAQAIASELRKDRLNHAGRSMRGERELKEARAIAALWDFAQQRALTIADADEDVTELARLLLRQAAGDSE
ncbi:MAG TPA: hypothetical protein VNY10_21340 [Roseiarcus sp.]|nr:hypothetical protein [Roseiarcus sp.]